MIIKAVDIYPGVRVAYCLNKQPATKLQTWVEIYVPEYETWERATDQTMIKGQSLFNILVDFIALHHNEIALLSHDCGKPYSSFEIPNKSIFDTIN